MTPTTPDTIIIIREPTIACPQLMPALSLPWEIRSEFDIVVGYFINQK
jgi:hypothetical protein